MWGAYSIILASTVLELRGVTPLLILLLKGELAWVEEKLPPPPPPPSPTHPICQAQWDSEIPQALPNTNYPTEWHFVFYSNKGIERPLKCSYKNIGLGKLCSIL